jgi:hypothetical protein
MLTASITLNLADVQALARVVCWVSRHSAPASLSQLSRCCKRCYKMQKMTYIMFGAWLYAGTGAGGPLGVAALGTHAPLCPWLLQPAAA